jgi:hypothetical protein
MNISESVYRKIFLSALQDEPCSAFWFLYLAIAPVRPFRSHCGQDLSFKWSRLLYFRRRLSAIVYAVKTCIDFGFGGVLENPKHKFP